MSVAQRVKNYREKKRTESQYKEECKMKEDVQKYSRPQTISSFRAAARERKRRNRELKRMNIMKDPNDKTKYQTHYVKKTVKNTYQSLPRSPSERAEVLAKLAEQALLKLEEQQRQKDFLKNDKTN